MMFFITADSFLIYALRASKAVPCKTSKAPNWLVLQCQAAGKYHRERIHSIGFSWEQGMQKFSDGL
ncbi:MAG: hypothetical protein ACLT3G_04930 [Acutalibacteraceae bacterium]